MSAMNVLASALRELGWTTSVIVAGGSELLKVEEAPALRSPVIRGNRFVWGDRSYVKPATLAARIDTFLRGE